MQWVKIMLAEEMLPLFHVYIKNNNINRLLFGLYPSRCDEGQCSGILKKTPEILNLAQP